MPFAIRYITILLPKIQVLSYVFVETTQHTQVPDSIVCVNHNTINFTLFEFVKIGFIGSVCASSTLIARYRRNRKRKQISPSCDYHLLQIYLDLFSLSYRIAGTFYFTRLV